jgi:hypothetical protein
MIAVFTASAHLGEVHGMAGNRYFPGTLTFDDPVVADELVFVTQLSSIPLRTAFSLLTRRHR